MVPGRCSGPQQSLAIENELALLLVRDYFKVLFLNLVKDQDLNFVLYLGPCLRQSLGKKSEFATGVAPGIQSKS